MTTTRIVRALLHKDPSYPANGSRECAPDDRLREDSTARHRELDCFVAEFIIGPAEGGTRWLLAMTWTKCQIRLRDPAARCVRVMHDSVRPKKTEGAGNAGCPMHPQP